MQKIESKYTLVEVFLLHYGEACLFWALVVAYLIPIWAFRYFPTQDGPMHLSSSIILKDYGSAGTRYHEFFDIRLEPFPNWTAHLLLAGLMFVVPALIAEKILLSVYVLAFAGSLRYICGAFGERTRPCALVGLLFVYNRCVWLGFYNFDLSLVLCLYVLGFWLRRRDQADLFIAAGLSLLLVLTFFTHLVGLLFTAAGLGWFALTSPKQRWRNLGWVGLAMLPAGLLTLDYLDRTGFAGSGAAHGMGNQFRQWFLGQGSWNRLFQDLTALDREFFVHHVQGDFPMALVVGLLYGLLASATLFAYKLKEETKSTNPSPSRWPVLVLALAFLIVYILVSDDLGEHGSFLKSRLALMPPLLILGWMALPVQPIVRLVLGTLVVWILAVNLVLVMERIDADNGELTEYIAGKKALGSGHILFVVQETQRTARGGKLEAANPLLHASQYYCLDVNNLNLDNYQAETSYFPLRFREGVRRGRGFFVGNKREKDVDVILAWGVNALPIIPPSFRPAFRQGRLAIFVKTP